jgi:hypothetical protein
MAMAQTSTTSGGLLSSLGIELPQNSSNPAIKAAALAKAAKHKIHKKKQALKYLAGLGCSPDRPEVAPALLAAMSDPDEPVRYEAVKAVLQTAGNCMSDDQKKAMRKALGFHEACSLAKDKCHKAVCDCIDALFGKAPPPQHKHELLEKLHGLIPNRKEECPDPATEEPEACGKTLGNCCSPEIREKLLKLAYGRDDNGCFLERSERVRTAAQQAVNACNACACAGACSGCEPAEGAVMTAREMPPADPREMRADDLSSGSADCDVVILPPCGCEPGSGSVLVHPLPEDMPWEEVAPLPVEEGIHETGPSAVEELPNVPPPVPMVRSTSVLVRPTADDDETIVIPLPPPR